MLPPKLRLENASRSLVGLPIPNLADFTTVAVDGRKKFDQLRLGSLSMFIAFVLGTVYPCLSH